MIDQRLNDLEIRFSFQDDYILKLNEVVTRQGLIIERLEREILDLKLTANSDGSVPSSRSLSDDKPPHY